VAEPPLPLWPRGDGWRGEGVVLLPAGAECGEGSGPEISSEDDDDETEWDERPGRRFSQLLRLFFSLCVVCWPSSSCIFIKFN
jgi:hypothetical protein